jgi:hypothetical protein
MKKNFLGVMIGVVGIVGCAAGSAFAAGTDIVRQVPGEIAWIDVKLGTLQLEGDASPKTGKITEYMITENETRVTDKTDQKFLSIKDLYPGERVTLEVINGKEGQVIAKITADPQASSEFQEAFGEVKDIDAVAGTLTLTGGVRGVEAADKDLTLFAFDPKTIIAMQSPSNRPMQLEIKPGDFVKVQFMVKDGKRQAHSITLYSPKVTSTVTTTTVTEIR